LKEAELCKSKTNESKSMPSSHQFGLSIVLACQAHKDQLDKGGEPYIFHPMHLATKLLPDEDLAAIAMLHDVIEDSDLTSAKLASYGFSDRVCTAVELLTHNRKDDYLSVYIKRIASNKDATVVKLLDLEHNSDMSRLGVNYEPTPKDLARLAKYTKAIELLQV